MQVGRYDTLSQGHVIAVRTTPTRMVLTSTDSPDAWVSSDLYVDITP